MEVIKTVTSLGDASLGLETFSSIINFLVPIKTSNITQVLVARLEALTLVVRVEPELFQAHLCFKQWYFIDFFVRGLAILRPQRVWRLVLSLFRRSKGLVVWILSR